MRKVAVFVAMLFVSTVCLAQWVNHVNTPKPGQPETEVMWELPSPDGQDIWGFNFALGPGFWDAKKRVKKVDFGPAGNFLAIITDKSGVSHLHMQSQAPPFCQATCTYDGEAYVTVNGVQAPGAVNITPVQFEPGIWEALLDGTFFGTFCGPAGCAEIMARYHATVWPTIDGNSALADGDFKVIFRPN